MTADLLVVGDTAWDTVVLAGRWPERDRDFPAVIREGAGGQGFNIAFWARRAGARVALVTQLGHDARSRELLRLAGMHGMELLEPTLQDPLTRVVSLVAGDGQKALLTHPGPGPLALPKPSWSAGMLVLSGYLLARPGGVERAGAWLDWAQAHAVPAAADLSHPDVAGAFAALSGALLWLFGNEAEWRAFLDAGGQSPAFRVVKRGPLGADLVRREGILSVLPATQSPAGDSTGAGDCLMGTLLGMTALGWNLPAALQAAVDRAAQVAQAPGALPDLGD